MDGQATKHPYRRVKKKISNENFQDFISNEGNFIFKDVIHMDEQLRGLRVWMGKIL